MVEEATRDPLRTFIAESNRIEGIVRDPSYTEIVAHESFIELDMPRVSDLEDFVVRVQPGAFLRQYQGMDVRVGNYRPPAGGVRVLARLERLMDDLGKASAYEIHRAYESIHPFMDGNGRSGRALWLWKVIRDTGSIPPLGFLHTWYYQSLDATGR